MTLVALFLGRLGRLFTARAGLGLLAGRLASANELNDLDHLVVVVRQPEQPEVVARDHACSWATGSCSQSTSGRQ